MIVHPVGKYFATPPTLADGEMKHLRVDSSGALVITSAGASDPIEVQGNVASLATDSGNPVKIGLVHNSTAPTVANLQRVDGQADSLGNMQVNQYTKIFGEDTTNDVMKSEVQTSYTNISASALIKTGAGRLSAIIVNSCAAGATIKVWDNTSAATTVLLNTITFAAAATQGGAILRFPEIKFNTGCYVTIAVAALDATICWN